MNTEKTARRIKTKRKILIITVLILLIGTLPCDASNSAGRIASPPILSLGIRAGESDPLSFYFTVNDTTFFCDVRSSELFRRAENFCSELIPNSVLRVAKRIACRN